MSNGLVALDKAFGGNRVSLTSLLDIAERIKQPHDLVPSGEVASLLQRLPDVGPMTPVGGANFNERLALMRCAICHGNANAGWLNVAAFPNLIKDAPLEQRAALATTNWKALDAKYASAVGALLTIGGGLLEAAGGVLATLTEVGAGIGIPVMWHGLDTATSGLTNLASRGEIQRPTMTNRILQDTYKLSPQEAQAFELVLSLYAGISKAPANANAGRGIARLGEGQVNAAGKFTGTVEDLVTALRTRATAINGGGQAQLSAIANRVEALNEVGNVRILSDTAFNELPGATANATGLYRNSTIYLRSSRGENILTDLVHEGVHAVDFGPTGRFAGIVQLDPNEVFLQEFRAFMAERLVTGQMPSGDLQSLIDHIVRNYRANPPK